MVSRIENTEYSGGLPESRPDSPVHHHPLFNCDLNSRLVAKVHCESERLTLKEARLLEVLLGEPNKVITEGALREKVWGSPFYSSEVVRDCICHLRRKLEPEPKTPTVIITALGGYYLADPRVSPAEEDIFQHPRFTFYLRKNSVMIDGEEVHLTPTEWRLLRVFTQNVNQIIDKETLIKQVWEEKEATDSELKFYIKLLRRKIEPNCQGDDYQYIRSRHGFGWGLFDPSREKESKVFRYPEFVFDPNKGLVRIGKKEIVLTRKENQLLVVLAEDINKFIPNEKLIDLVWQADGATDSELKYYIHNLRRKIEPDFRRPKHILTKRFFGYGLFDPSKE